MKFEAPPNRLIEALNGVLALSHYEIADELVLRLGSKLTALIANQAATLAVRDWWTGSTEPPYHTMVAALQAARAVAMRYDNVAARAWFMSSNPNLEMISPVKFLCNARLASECDRLVMCAVQDVS